MMALILCSTHQGVTRRTTEEIAKTLREENFEVKVVDAQEEKVKDTSEYDLEVFGSGVGCSRWVNDTEDFMRKWTKDRQRLLKGDGI
jgi:menaquinone-dependent protoporphyrinogen IX oxidase